MLCECICAQRCSAWTGQPRLSLPGTGHLCRTTSHRTCRYRTLVQLKCACFQSADQDIYRVLEIVDEWFNSKSGKRTWGFGLDSYEPGIREQAFNCCFAISIVRWDVG